MPRSVARVIALAHELYAPECWTFSAPQVTRHAPLMCRRMLRAPLAAALNAQHLDAQQADLSLQLDFDHQASYDEHLALAQGQSG